MEAEEQGGEDGQEEEVDVDIETIEEGLEQPATEEHDAEKAAPAAADEKTTRAETEVHAVPYLSLGHLDAQSSLVEEQIAS